MHENYLPSVQVNYFTMKMKVNKILYRKVTHIIILFPKIYILPPQKVLEFTGGGVCCMTKTFKKCIKVHDIKNFSAYLKGISKYKRMAFLFLQYLFSFQRDIFPSCKLDQ